MIHLRMRYKDDVQRFFLIPLSTFYVRQNSETLQLLRRFPSEHLEIKWFAVGIYQRHTKINQDPTLRSGQLYARTTYFLRAAMNDQPHYLALLKSISFLICN